MTTRTTNLSEAEAKAQLHTIALLNSALNEYHQVLTDQGFNASLVTDPIWQSYKESVNRIGQNMEPKKDHLRFTSQAGTYDLSTIENEWLKPKEVEVV